MNYCLLSPCLKVFFLEKSKIRHEWRHLVFISFNPCFGIIEKLIQVHLAKKCGCWTLNPGLSEFKIHVHSATPRFCPRNLVVILWISSTFQHWGCWALFNLLIEDIMVLTQNRDFGLKVDSQIGACYSRYLGTEFHQIVPVKDYWPKFIPETISYKIQRTKAKA